MEVGKSRIVRLKIFDDFTEQPFSKCIAVTDEIVNEQAQADDNASYCNSNYQLHDYAWILCHESSDVMHIRENQDVVNKIYIQSTDADIL